MIEILLQRFYEETHYDFSKYSFEVNNRIKEKQRGVSEEIFRQEAENYHKKLLKKISKIFIKNKIKKSIQNR